MTETTPAREALEWIAMFAEMRATDDSKTFARVNRGALRTIAEKASVALAALSPPAVSEAVEAEREACAKVADEASIWIGSADYADPFTKEKIAAAIRARTSISEVEG